MERNHSVQALITKGEIVAIKIKLAFFEHEKWTPKLCLQVADKMTKLKKIARPLYAEMDELQFLNALGGYSPQDIRDAFQDYDVKEDTCRESQLNNIGGHITRSMGIP